MNKEYIIPPGYQFKKELTTSAAKANVVAIVMALPLMLAFSIPYLLIWKQIVSLDVILAGRENLLPTLGIIVAGIVTHELLHGLGWALFAKGGFKTIRFGVIWHMLTPYCHCTVPLSLPAYLFGGLLPAVAMGIVPCSIAMASGNMGLMIFGLFFTLAAGGDFLVAWMLRKQGKSDVVMDHPNKIGCIVLERVD